MSETENTQGTETTTEPEAPPGGFQFDINAILAQALAVIKTPKDYFRNMPVSGGFVEPLIFAITLALAAGIISAVLSFVGSPVGFLAYGLAAIVFVPIGATFGLFVGGGILFVIWKLMGSERDYEASVRCAATMTAIYPIMAVLYLVPYLGTIVGLAWGAYLAIEASVAVHGRERKKAQIVFGVLAALGILMNVSAERTARNLADQAEELSKVLEQSGN
ncbi:MAG: YIP1 family protein [Xanthomonadales bacterium]|nr:YIP1 family protein [Xanthomonadales bacterium]